jgi:hypothetical protein
VETVTEEARACLLQERRGKVLEIEMQDIDEMPDMTAVFVYDLGIMGPNGGHTEERRGNMEHYDEMTVKVLHVTEELDATGAVLTGPMLVVGGIEDDTLPYIPQSKDYPVKGLKGLREQLDALLFALKEYGLMYSGVIEEPEEAVS